MKSYILINHIKVQNANALSSPYTIGFPAMTAWLGAVHALQRNINKDEDFSDIQFTAAAVVCNDFDLKVYKGQGDFVNSIIGTANPLKKDGNRASFIEEARCSFEASIVIETKNFYYNDKEELQVALETLLYSRIKIAGGDILSFKGIEFQKIDSIEDFNLFKKKLMPGYVLVERRDLMLEAMKNNQDAIDALLDYLTVKNTCNVFEDGEIVWNKKRLTSGWIVPIATGFHGISELGKAKNQRDPDTPHRFAESVITLGEFVMPYRIEKIEDMLWKYSFYENRNLYICENLNNKLGE